MMKRLGDEFLQRIDLDPLARLKYRVRQQTLLGFFGARPPDESMTQIHFRQAAILCVAALLTIGNGFIFCQEIPKNSAAPPGQKPTGSSSSTNDRTKSAGGNQVAIDQYGDPLPPGAFARLGTVRFRHSSRVGPLAYSRDGKTLLSAGRSIRFWDVATGKLVREVPWPHSAVFSVAISPDGRLIAEIGTTPTGGGEDVVHLREAATGKEVGQLSGDHSWDFMNGRPLKSIARGLGVVAFAPDGKRLVTVSNPFPGRGQKAAKTSAVIRFWDIASKTETQSLEAGEDSVLSLQISSNGDLLTWVGNHPALVLRNVTQGKELGRFTLPKGSYVSGALSPDEKVVALAGQNPSTDASGVFETNAFLELRGFASGRVLYKTKPQSSGIYGLVWSPNRAALAWPGGDYFVRICNSATGEFLFLPNGHMDEINYLRFGPDGKTLISGSRDGTARLWDVASRKELRRFETRQGYLETIALSPDGKTIASPIGPRLWDVHSGKEWPQFAHHEMRANCVAFSPDGKSLAAPGLDRAIHIWDLATGAERLRCGEQSLGATPIRSMAFSPNGEILATANDYGMMRASGKIDLWEVATGKQIRTFGSGKMVSYQSLAFSPNGKWLVTGSGWWGRDSGIRLWDVSTGLETEPSVPQVDSALSVIFSPDNRYLISTEREGAVRLWEVATRQEVKRFSVPDLVSAVAFSPDGKTIATAASDTTILLWPTLVQDRQPGDTPRVLSAEELRTSWAALAGDDAAKSFQAIEIMVSAPQQSVPLIKEQLAQLLVQFHRIAKLITDLDDDSFEVREKSTTQLEKLGVIAEPALRAKLADQPSAEVRRRAERILRETPRSSKASAILQATRAITTLEYVGTPEARQLLQSIAQMKPKDWLSEEANASLKRLAPITE
jgi:WD40 repeat protein